MTKKKHTYHNVAQERALLGVLALAGHEAEGLSPSVFARQLNITPSVATRDLWNLCNAGFAEQLESGNYRLTPKPVQVALAFQRSLAALKERHDEITHRYTRKPR